jgi:hypothetical protein
MAFHNLGLSFRKFLYNTHSDILTTAQATAALFDAAAAVLSGVSQACPCCTMGDPATGQRSLTVLLQTSISALSRGQLPSKDILAALISKVKAERQTSFTNNRTAHMHP